MQIKLRPITLEDGKLIVKWRNSEKVSKHCLNKNPITIESNAIFYRNNILTGAYLQFIVEKITDSVIAYPIGTAYLKDIDRTNKRCELCIFTSDDEEWNTESQAIAIKLLLEKAFNELKMHKVYSYAFYKFIDEATLLKNAGFTIEAVLRNEAVDENGNYDDIIRFAAFNKQEKSLL